jgi:hypothetical protein
MQIIRVSYGKYHVTEEEQAMVNCIVKEFLIASVRCQIASTKKQLKKLQV